MSTIARGARRVLIARNDTRGCVLMDQGRSADRPWSRMRGLIGSEQLVPGQSLWITPCNGIHMLFMSFPIDVVYLDKRLVVVAVDELGAPEDLHLWGQIKPDPAAKNLQCGRSSHLLSRSFHSLDQWLSLTSTGSDRAHARTS